MVPNGISGEVEWLFEGEATGGGAHCVHQDRSRVNLWNCP